MNTKIKVRTATQADAEIIARAVAMAIGDEITLRNYCGENYHSVLTEIAAHRNTQYLWKNLTNEGK